jgi:hypothetical protein
MLATILLVFAFCLAAIAAFWNPPKINLGWLGFALYVLSLLLRGVHIS